MSFRLLALTISIAASLPAHAAISIASPASVYTQNFDTLATSGSPSWINDSTLSGWSLFIRTGGAASSYTAENGASNAGSFRSFGASGSSDRSLGGTGSGGTYFGSPVSGAIAGWIAVAFTNSSASDYTSFSLSFDGEQWRNGGNTSAQSMVLEYGFGSSFAAVSSWTAPGGTFDWSSPVTGSTAAAVNGNGTGLVTGLGGTVTTAWTPGQTLWVRWIEKNDVGNDHGLAVDNVSFSVTSAVPEPGSYALLLAGLAAVGFVSRRRA